MTSGTVGSARLLGERLPVNVIHQYIPVDRVPWFVSFSITGNPIFFVGRIELAMVLSEVEAQKIPALLMNARISASSLRGWRRAPWMIRRLLKTFDLCAGANRTGCRSTTFSRRTKHRLSGQSEICG